MKPMIKFYALLLIASLMCISEVCAQKQRISDLKSGRNDDTYFKVWLTDANTGIAVGEGYYVDGNDIRSLILRTEDGGDTWNSQTHPNINNGPFSYLYDMCFSDLLNGWTVGQAGTILNTKDGGITWTNKSAGIINDPIWSVFCTDSNTVWASGTLPARFYHTTNGGQTWNTLRTKFNTFIWDIFFINADTGIAAGGSCETCGVNWSGTKIAKGSFILRTADRGETWELQECDTNNIGYQSVFFANDTIGYVAGSGGVIKRTTDGGKTWIKQESGTTAEFWGMYFMNVDTGFVVGGKGSTGYSGKMLYTKDGGTTWIEKDIPTNKALYGIHFADENTGIAVGDWGAIISTTSGGESWTLHDWSVSSINSNQLLTGQNFPNPFTRSTTIRYEVLEAGNITLKIYSLDGKIIATLVDEEMWPGIYEVTWDAGDLPAGVYFCSIKAVSSFESRKLVLQK